MVFSIYAYIYLNGDFSVFSSVAVVVGTGPSCCSELKRLTLGVHLGTVGFYPYMDA